MSKVFLAVAESVLTKIVKKREHYDCRGQLVQDATTDDQIQSDLEIAFRYANAFVVKANTMDLIVDAYGLPGPYMYDDGAGVKKQPEVKKPVVKKFSKKKHQ